MSIWIDFWEFTENENRAMRYLSKLIFESLLNVFQKKYSIKNITLIKGGHHTWMLPHN